MPSEKSRSCASEKSCTNFVVATLSESSVVAWVVAVEPSGKITPAVGNFKVIAPTLQATVVAVVSICLTVPALLRHYF